MKIAIVRERVEGETRVAATPEELRAGLAGRGVLVVKVEAGNAEVPVIPLSPEEILRRFMAISAPPSPSS